MYQLTSHVLKTVSCPHLQQAKMIKIKLLDLTKKIASEFNIVRLCTQKSA